MGCYKPLQAWQLDGGEIVFSERGKVRRELELPCGQCIGCRLERSRQWAVRCVHEAACHESSSFVTLTYSDEFVPRDFSLNYRDYQLFSKRLRKAVGPFRFYMCGEYGDDFSRPHFHACLFGVDFPDRYLWSDKGGVRLYRSPLLERIWGRGYASIGDVTFESAAYVARYVTKKVNGDRAADHYFAVDGETGEAFWRRPEFSRMSLKPGIGVPWFNRFRDEVYPSDQVVIRGRPMKPPKAYDKKLEVDWPIVAEEVKYSRYVKAIVNSDENTSERRAVKEAVAHARSKFYNKRSL